MKLFLFVILIFIGFFVGLGLFNFILVSSGLALSGLEQQNPILQPFIGAAFIILLILLLLISYRKTSARAKEASNETRFKKLAGIYLSFRWGQIFLVDLVILLTITLLLMTNL